ncbi:response regulator transcription factor [Rossellomorea sp. BNER]|jgi:two-component system, OmpR family, response regulator|uniref:response regulator transcription factor n=1 Tax=Rossellomorea sp. BNER TaxID=2962031 RepID=UPI003AF2DA71|nr:response regulator transcription factor [Rossellomorea sp. BNER]
MKNILVVDDDQHVRHIVRDLLAKEGYHVLEAENGIKALELLQKEDCTLAIVDIMMPHMDGYHLTGEIRKHYDIPVILLTSKGELEDKEKGFSSGTDDYVVKPFEPKELLFRVNAILRRYGMVHESSIKLGNLYIDKKSYEVKVNDKTYLLPLKEFELLAFLASHLNQVFSREQIIEKIWGLEYEGDDRTVDVHIKRLRGRFSSHQHCFSIKTVRGVGYYMELNENEKPVL